MEYLQGKFLAALSGGSGTLIGIQNQARLWTCGRGDMSTPSFESHRLELKCASIMTLDRYVN